MKFLQKKLTNLMLTFVLSLSTFSICNAQPEDVNPTTKGVVGGGFVLEGYLEAESYVYTTEKLQGKKIAVFTGLSFNGEGYDLLELTLFDSKGRLVASGDSIEFPIIAFTPKKSSLYTLYITNLNLYPVYFVIWTN